MRPINLKIQTQLQLGFALIFLLVLGLGWVALIQTDQIAGQTSKLYNHPVQVRRAIGKLTTDILEIRLGMRDLAFTSPGAKQAAEIIHDIELYQSDAFDQIAILASQYLGPKSDVDLAKQEFIRHKSSCDLTIRLLQEGKIAEAQTRTLSGGEARMQAQAVMNALKKIDAFALGKGDELYANSQSLQAGLQQQLLFIVTAILLLAVAIGYFLLHSIRRPLDTLTRATQAFQGGDLAARSSYALKNEFGDFSESFNHMAATVQVEMEAKAAVAGLSALMGGINEAREFFQAALPALAEKSGSQMAAVYFLSRDRKSFEHFASIGLDAAGRASFGADDFDGEFGAALASRKIQHITGIPADTRFTFATVGGTFTPREIITLPITSNSHTVAIVSLATIGGYSQSNLRFVHEIWQILNARVAGILAFRQIQALAESLEQQNRELDAQKSELNAQSMELTQQNAELEAQKSQLVEASRQKTSFVSNMSHELRTPLNSVIALSGVLNRRLAGQIPDDEYGYLEVIERNGKQLLVLINDILDLSRIEAGREDLEIAQFDPGHLVAEVVASINPLAHQKKIELAHTPAPRLAPMRSDAGKIRHILQNLLGNAVKFTEAGQVEISARQEGADIHITVRDTGIGIAQDQFALIFDEFKQADGSNTRRFGGTGLGLTIARKYARLLGGEITVESVLGQGSVFTLRLPLHLEQDIKPGIEADGNHTKASVLPVSSGTASASGQKTLLVVEDSEPAVIQLQDIFAAPAYRILVARNGHEALEIIRHTLPDAILLDLMMPGMDGFEVLKTVRNAERTAHLPVLILTAKAITKEELRFLKNNHVHQLIQKGDINRAELLDAVASLFRPATGKAAKPQPGRQTIEGKPRVLVVEDNPDNMLTVKALMAADFTIIEATDGQAAVQQAKKHLPHLILMDIALPGMDGIQAFKQIRQDTACQSIPVIALTASAMTSDREAILAYGFDGYIPKPIEHQEFMRTIRGVLYGE
jgi:signal transduction histidine kinase/CheY-like chemotaxis protein/HAMP domain-containing protein